MIPFNKPYLTGNEGKFIDTAFQKGKFSGNGYFTQKCHTFFEESYDFGRCFLTNSATNALEMAAILCEISEGDEVILPSYTFVSTATPFAMRGAAIVFCDNSKNNPNIDAQQIELLITEKTKAIVIVHYAGMACDMDVIMELANSHGIIVIEDAAHAITSKHKDNYLGSIGHLAALSFHETKNVSCGQGGMLIVNDETFCERAEVVWAKGTNRLDMERGKVSKYEWVDYGSNFYPSEISAALLYAQLEKIDFIQERRKAIWEVYQTALAKLEEKELIELPKQLPYQTNNYHIFYFLCQSNEVRDQLLEYLKTNGALAVFHYLPLHRSPFIEENNPSTKTFPNADKFAERTVRLPLYVDLEIEQVEKISEFVLAFFGV
jgi:dTDP-4-amino-4,6-dideoxygalactose transaminase